MTLLLALQLLALGGCVGFMAGLLGIGGGMLLVPFLTYLFRNQGVAEPLAFKMAIATSMATILFTSLSSVRAHHRRGAVRWDVVRSLAPGIVTAGLLAGSTLFAALHGKGLMFFFVAFLTFSATQMVLDRKPKPSRQMPGTAGRWAAGGVIGLLSGLVGAGGAFVSAPFMLWCNIPMAHVVGTAAALGFPIAAANVAGYVIGGLHLPPPLPGAVGYLHLPALAVIACASVLVAPVGVRVAHQLPTRELKRIFAVMLYGLAAVMTYRALSI